MIVSKLAMIIDDDHTIRQSLAELLRDEGYRVVTARDGCEALTEIHRGERPHVILLDLMMPVMNGIEFRRRQAASEFADVPVIIYSAAADVPAEVAPGGHLAGQALLTKPLDLDLIVEAVRKAIR